jgi:cell division septation protein DedD
VAVASEPQVAAVDEAPASGDPTAVSEPTPVGDEELNYAERLKQKDPAEELKAREPKTTPQDKPQPVASSPTPAPAAAPPAEPAADVPTSGRPGAWVIQVHALSNRSTASSVVKGLIGKGYPAFLLLPPKGQPQIYRVQIGRYRDRNEAAQVARRLQKEEQFKPEIKR